MPIGLTTAIVGAAAIGGGTAIYASNKAASATKKAARQAAQVEQESADKQVELQQKQYEQTRGDLAPYRDAGSGALSTYRDALGLNGSGAANRALAGYTESPYLSRLVDRTRQSVEASRAARGGLFSGGAMQEIGDRTGDLYLGDYNNYLSRLGGLIDTGQNAAAQTGSFGANAAAGQAGAIQRAANASSNAYLTAGNASANNAINTSNSINNMLSQMAGTYGAYKGGAFGNSGGGMSTPDQAKRILMGY